MLYHAVPCFMCPSRRTNSDLQRCKTEHSQRSGSSSPQARVHRLFVYKLYQVHLRRLRTLGSARDSLEAWHVCRGSLPKTEAAVLPNAAVLGTLKPDLLRHLTSPAKVLLCRTLLPCPQRPRRCFRRRVGKQSGTRPATCSRSRSESGAWPRQK